MYIMIKILRFIEILSDIIPVTSLGSCTELGKDPSAFRYILYSSCHIQYHNKMINNETCLK